MCGVLYLFREVSRWYDLLCQGHPVVTQEDKLKHSQQSAGYKHRRRINTHKTEDEWFEYWSENILKLILCYCQTSSKSACLPACCWHAANMTS